MVISARARSFSTFVLRLSGSVLRPMLRSPRFRCSCYTRLEWHPQKLIQPPMHASRFAVEPIVSKERLKKPEKISSQDIFEKKIFLYIFFCRIRCSCGLNVYSYTIHMHIWFKNCVKREIIINVRSFLYRYVFPLWGWVKLCLYPWTAG